MNLKFPSPPDKDAFKRFVSDIFRNLLAIYIILLVFSFISPGYVEFYIDLNKFLYPMMVLGAASLLFYAERLESSDRNRFDVAKKRISYAFLGLLLIVAVQFIAPSVLEWERTPLMVAAVALGAIAFYLNRDALDEIEEEARQEEVEEKRREMEFAGRYPRVNRVWGVRWAARWMYREGWVYSLIFILIIINAFFIRFDNLGMLPLQNDEFSTAEAVKSILSGNLSATDFISGSDDFQSPDFYSRAWLYSLSVAVIVKNLGTEYPYSYFSLRFFSVIVGTFTLLFFYILLRFYKINKIISLATVYSFSTFFIFVYYSRVARMYVLLLLLFFLNLILIYNLFEKIRKSNDSFTLDFKRYFIQIFLIIFVLVISINIHMNVLTLVIPFYLLSLYHYKSNKKFRTIFKFGTLLLLIIMSVYYFNLFEIIPIWYFNIYNQIYYQFLKYSYSYLSGKEISLILFISLLINIFLKYDNINKLIKISYLIFIPILLFFIFLANGKAFHDPRYIIFLYPLYSFIIIYSLYYLSRVLTSDKKLISIFVFIFLLILIVSKIQIATICYDSSLTECPISHESRIFSIDRWNYNYDEIYSTIKNNIQPHDILVGRAIYPYYLNKYDIKNDAYVLTNRTKIPIAKIKEHDVVFVIHPELIYRAQEIETNQNVYIYLYNKQKTLLYKSNDRKTMIYKIEKSDQ